MDEVMMRRTYMVLTGALTGLANGFFGGGGGMIVVPLMTYLLKMKTQNLNCEHIPLKIHVLLA